MKQSSLKKDVFWNTLGSLVGGFLIFVLTVFITHLNGLQASGIFGFAFSVAAIFSAIAYYGGRNYQVTDVVGEFEQADYIKVRLSMSLVAVLAVVIFIFANRFNADTTLLILVIMGYRLLDSVSDVLYGVLQVHDRLHQAGKSNFIKSLTSILGFMAIDYVTNDILLASLMFIVVFMVGIVILDIRNIRRISPSTINLFTSWRIKTIATKLLPFAIVVFLPTTITNLAKYFIQLWYPNDQGYFNIIVMPLFFLTLVVYFVVAPFLTRMARTLHEQRFNVFKKNVGQVSLLVVAIGFALLPITYFLGPVVLKLIFGIEFRPYALQLTLVVISGILYTLAVFYSDVLLILRKLKMQLMLLAVLLLINVSLSLFFVKNYAINGAITVSIITNALWLGAYWLAYYMTLQKRIRG